LLGGAGDGAEVDRVATHGSPPPRRSPGKKILGARAGSQGRLRSSRLRTRRARRPGARGRPGRVTAGPGAPHVISDRRISRRAAPGPGPCEPLGGQVASPPETIPAIGPQTLQEERVFFGRDGNG